jgi:hypothetical protein
MRTVVLGALSFAICTITLKLVLPALLWFQGPRRPNAFDDFLVVLYLVALSSSLSTLGFLIPTAASATWRRLAPKRGVIIAAGLSLISPIALLLVLAVSAPAILPLFRQAPWVAIGLQYGLPGLMLGAAAVLIARTQRRAATKDQPHLSCSHASLHIDPSRGTSRC